MRILFVLTGDGEADVRVLAQALDPARFRIDVVSCPGPDGLPQRTYPQLRMAGIAVDTGPCHLPAGQRAEYLASIVPGYDTIVAGRDNVALDQALAGLYFRPSVIALDTPTPSAIGAGDAVVSRWIARFEAARRPRTAAGIPLFKSFFHGGFECSTHRRSHDRTRIDVIATTRHDVLAASDYAVLRNHGILTVRDGLRWHLIERRPGVYDWSSLDHQLAAAATGDTQVIWDLLHYGWPDDVDVWQPDFVARFAAFAAAAARVIGARAAGPHFYAPVNEISFLSWGGGDVGYLNPYGHHRGFELKVQLARAAIAAMDAIRQVDPAARFVHADPVINIVADPARPHDIAPAEGHRQAQFQAWDMIAGRAWPQIGGRADLLDIVGVNFYHNNQWIHGGATIRPDHAQYRPFHRILAETYARYGRPIFIAETGIEGAARPGWLASICDEVALAIDLGVPIEGICLYPVLDHPGWDDDRYCPNGLLHAERDVDVRRPFLPLAAELARQQGRFS